jgi:hypothetical protein
MLKGKSKTVICVDLDDLIEFIVQVYELSDWEFCGGDNGDMRLFDIHPKSHDKYHEFAGYNIQSALQVIMDGDSEYWSDIGGILARLCFDGYIPKGNYLVEHSW